MKENLHVIVGLGVTGLSCATYLMKKSIPIAIVDSRENPPGLQEFKRKYPEIRVEVGTLDTPLLEKAAHLVVSPGISLKDPCIAKQMQRGANVIGDIELFAQTISAPVIAITGTNAKSTVTTLVGEMAKTAGLNVQVGGNLGTPALDLLSDVNTELYVLELSSFQLETTYSLKPKVATILNITPDHMDRYDTLADYAQAKQRIYQNCATVVWNSDDPLTQFSEDKPTLSFTLNAPEKAQFGLHKKNNQIYLAYEEELLLNVKELPILGRHYQANALSALAIGYGFGLPMKSMLQTLLEFKGLPHRCQWVRELYGVYWYNDSKGTNVGATNAAIEGLGPEVSGKLILIAGGVGKKADFSSLVPPIEKHVKAVILIGEAASQMAFVIGDRSEVYFAEDMPDAVRMAASLGRSGDCVLLSPACASFDMFNNYEHRGDVFTNLVKQLT